MFQVGFLICDPTGAKPDLLKDKFWDSVIPSQLPYTKVGTLSLSELCYLDVDPDNQQKKPNGQCRYDQVG